MSTSGLLHKLNPGQVSSHSILQVPSSVMDGTGDEGNREGKELQCILGKSVLPLGWNVPELMGLSNVEGCREQLDFHRSFKEFRGQ